MKKNNKIKTIITILVSAFVIVLGLFGANWQVGQAETVPTVPTLPIIYSFAPQQICVNSGDTLVTVNGGDFIDTTYTWIKWLDAFNNFSYIIPNSINAAGTELIFTVEAAKLTQVYEAAFWIENHPPNSPEIVGPFYINIIGCEHIYLPMIAK